MAPQKSKEHTRPTNVAALPSATRTFFSAIAAPLTIAFTIAFVGSVITGWRNDILFNEELGVIAKRVAELESLAKQGGRYTSEQAKIDGDKMDGKYAALLQGLTELRILVATKMASDKAP